MEFCENVAKDFLNNLKTRRKKWRPSLKASLKDQEKMIQKIKLTSLKDHEKKIQNFKFNNPLSWCVKMHVLNTLYDITKKKHKSKRKKSMKNIY